MEFPPRTTPPISEESIPTIPAPPSEVSIRTMASDIRAMVNVGGGKPEYQHIPIRKSGPQKPKAPIVSASVIRTVGLVVSGVALFALSVVAFYFLYPIVARQISLWRGGGVAVTPPPPTPVGPPIPPPRQQFTHTSFLKVPADRAVAFPTVLEGNASGTRPYGEKLLPLLASYGPSTGIFEIIPQTGNGEPLSFAEFIQNAGAPIFDEQFLSTNFVPDFTMFSYRDQLGFWPGFILQLKKEKNPAYVSISKIESGSGFEKLFLNAPGVPMGEFEDVVIGDHGYRRLLFSAPSAALYYGWYKNYLVIATTELGFKFAISRL